MVILITKPNILKKYIFSILIILVTLTFTIHSNFELLHQIYHLGSDNKYVHYVNDNIDYNVDYNKIDNFDKYDKSSLNNNPIFKKLFIDNSNKVQKSDFDNYVLNNQKYIQNTVNFEDILNLKVLEDFNYYKSLRLKTILRINSNKAPPLIV